MCVTPHVIVGSPCYWNKCFLAARSKREVLRILADTKNVWQAVSIRRFLTLLKEMLCYSKLYFSICTGYFLRNRLCSTFQSKLENSIGEPDWIQNRFPSFSSSLCLCYCAYSSWEVTAEWYRGREGINSTNTWQLYLKYSNFLNLTEKSLAVKFYQRLLRDFCWYFWQVTWEN